MKARPLWDSSLPDEERLDDLLAELTLEEKLQCLGTGCPGIERLGIEPFYLGGEGAHGVQRRHDQSFDRGEPQPTTIFPNPIGMSATWDTDLMEQEGDVVGAEARAAFEKEGRKGGLCLWAPTVDMERDPRWGRTEESYGEDPYLTGKMASAYIRGMRGKGKRIRCGATLKHFYANNVEQGRGWKSSSIDPRNKYEYYLEPFRRAIVEGGAEGIMTSYNAINGVPATINPEISRIAKDQWGLRHVVSDGGAMIMTAELHDFYGSHTETVAAGLKAGMDCFTDNIELVVEGAREALELGLITMEDIDRALRCHFGAMMDLGLFDREETGAMDASSVSSEGEKLVSGEMLRDKSISGENARGRSISGEEVRDKSILKEKVREGSVSEKLPGKGTPDEILNHPSHQALARNVSAESVVLLKNAPMAGSPLLPLASAASETLAMIGPSADEWFMDWYSGKPPYTVSALEGIREAAPQRVLYESGNPQLKLACEDQYLGLLEDGRTLGLVPKEKAETFELVLWDKKRCTLRCMSNGRYLAAEDGTTDDGDYRQGIITATSEAAFGWFVKESFQLYEGRDGLPLLLDGQPHRRLRNEEPLILHSWNNSSLFIDDQGRIRLPEEDGFVENGEQVRIRSYTGGDGVRMEIHENGQEALEKSGDFETITGTVYRTLPPLQPLLVKDGIEASIELAQKADRVIYVGGAHPMVTCKEENDREDIDYPSFQRELLKELHQSGKPLILALLTSVPYAIDWEKEHIPAILTMATGGMEQGHGLADILFGKRQPAGRLNMTWYQSTEQLPDINDYDIIQHERTYLYFDKEVLYPFGHGLTYAQIDYTGLTARLVKPETGEGVLKVTGTIVNRSQTIDSAEEVVQLYVTKKASAVKRTVRQLIGFQRLRELPYNKPVEVTFDIPLEDLTYYDTIQRRKLLEPGEYELQLGRSSRDILQTTVITLQGEERGKRETGPWQPADHFDRLENGYLWLGHMGYDSVAHLEHASAEEDLMQEMTGLWQNVNEVSHGAETLANGFSSDGAASGLDDSLLLEYERVQLPKGSCTLILDAEGSEDALIDIRLDEETVGHIALKHQELAERKQDRAYQRQDGHRLQGRLFRQYEMPIENDTARLVTLRFTGHGSLRICRWRMI